MTILVVNEVVCFLRSRVFSCFGVRQETGAKRCVSSAADSVCLYVIIHMCRIITSSWLDGKRGLLECGQWRLGKKVSFFWLLNQFSLIKRILNTADAMQLLYSWALRDWSVLSDITYNIKQVWTVLTISSTQQGSFVHSECGRSDPSITVNFHCRILTLLTHQMCSWQIKSTSVINTTIRWII